MVRKELRVLVVVMRRKSLVVRKFDRDGDILLSFSGFLTVWLFGVFWIVKRLSE